MLQGTRPASPASSASCRTISPVSSWRTCCRSTIGGDALRVSRQSRDNGQSPTSFASVVLERMTGWLVLPVITLVGAVGEPRSPSSRPGRRAVAEVVAGVTLVLLVVVLSLTARPGATTLAHNEGWRRFASAVRMGIRQLVHDPAAASRVIATGFAYQLVLVASALMAARALGMPARRRPDRPAGIRAGGAHRPGPADHDLRPRRPRGPLRPVPATARCARVPGNRASVCCCTC